MKSPVILAVGPEQMSRNSYPIVNLIVSLWLQAFCNIQSNKLYDFEIAKLALFSMLRIDISTLLQWYVGLCALRNRCAGLVSKTTTGKQYAARYRRLAQACPLSPELWESRVGVTLLRCGVWVFATWEPGNESFSLRHSAPARMFKRNGRQFRDGFHA